MGSYPKAEQPMQEIQTRWDSGDFSSARERVCELALHASDRTTLAALVRWHKRLIGAAAEHPDGLQQVRLAVLGNATTTYVVSPLALLLEAHGLYPVIHEATYDSTAHELLHHDSSTAKFAPQIAVVLNSPLALGDWPPPTDADAATEWADSLIANWLSRFESAHHRLGCDLIVDNLHALPLRPYGNLSPSIPGDRNTLLRKVNATLATRAPDYVFIHDVEALAAMRGVNDWIDQRLWFQAKQPMGFGPMVDYCRSLAGMISSMFVGAAKCLVLDLDNTLWGGVVGDDGVSNLLIGAGDPVGEAFTTFQDYLKRLKERGILLAVCSKNDEHNARAPFEQLDEMVLQLDDFAAFRANWNPKPDNLRSLARELNIGLDSMVFIDDNPAERSLVERTLPQIRVLQLSDDPADYPVLLDRSGWFETPRLSREDTERANQYRDNSKRLKALESSTDYEEYLKSLEQTATIRPFQEHDIDRINQLINKTNQFNLTTLRQTRAEVTALSVDPHQLTASVRLRDRFGDNGLISVFHGRVCDAVLVIEQWLMSCRVFNRGVEQTLMNYIVEQARERGIHTIHGRYIPTKKNHLVADLYQKLGFHRTADTEDAVTEWELAVRDFKPFETAVRIEKDR